jgi:hypothetical protein
MHALRLTGTRAEPRWLHGGRPSTRANTRAPSRQGDANGYVLWAMEASLHLHTALPGIADAEAAEHARAAVVALDNMIKDLQQRGLPEA